MLTARIDSQGNVALTRETARQQDETKDCCCENALGCALGARLLASQGCGSRARTAAPLHFTLFIAFLLTSAVGPDDRPGACRLAMFARIGRKSHITLSRLSERAPSMTSGE